VELIHALLARGASLGQKNLEGMSALHVAMRAQDEAAVELLLEKGAWAVEKRKRDVLVDAAACGLMPLVMKNDLPQQTFGQAENGRSAAAAAADAARTRRVVASYRAAVPAVVSRVPKPSQAGLDEALPSPIGSQIQEPCGELPPRPATCPVTDNWGRCSPQPPRAATSLGTCDARVILPCRATAPIDDHFRRTFVRALRRGEVGVLRQLFVEDGARVHSMKFDLGFGELGNCVDWAVVKEFPTKAILLLEIADDVGIGDVLACEALPAFFWSVVQGYTVVLESLLKRGAVISRTHRVWSSGDSALDIAVFGSRGPEAEALLSAGAWELESEVRRAELLRWSEHRPTMIQVFKKAGILQ
jgi:hypothetical protein